METHGIKMDALLIATSKRTLSVRQLPTTTQGVSAILLENSKFSKCT